MSKVVTSSVAVALLLLAIAGCKSSGSGDSMDSMKMNGGSSSMATSPSPTTMPAAMTYTCTMHPEVVSNKPGKCPKCGMDLVAKQ